MKILALTSSYRKRGNTARVVEMVANHLEATAERQQQPLDVEVLNLAHLDLAMCRGCRTCFDRGEEACPLKDDVPAIKAKLDEADGVVLASPVYVNDVNGVAKNLIDRLAYVCHRPAFAGKCAYLVATVADGPTGFALFTMNQALRSWGYHIVGQTGFKMGALMDQEEMEERYQAQAAEIAADLYRAVSERAFLRPSFLSLMTFRIQQLSWKGVSPDSLDYAYWEEKGWFDPDRTFYIDHRANPLKVRLARLVGRTMAGSVT
jgi:multimeric flavodoxin WrbA